MRPFAITGPKMKRVAVFVDAGYFWVQVCTLLSGNYTSRGNATIDYKALRIAMLGELKTQFSDCDLLRIYWYDGPGNNGKTTEHLEIDYLDDFKLRLGTRNSVGSQKGVDGLIIADLISLTQQKAITHALLVTGDSDIAPGVIAAQGMGLRVHLLSIGAAAATSPYLAAEADYKHSWGSHETAKFASTTLVAPATSVAITASTPVASQSTVDLTAVAKIAHTQIQNGRLASTLATLPSNIGMLPKDVDSELLFSAVTQLKRKLSSDEKKDLRVHFRALL